MNGFLVVLIIILLYYIYVGVLFNEYILTDKVKSDYDDNYYNVVKKYQDHENAADKIAKINKFAVSLIKKLQQVYLNTEFAQNGAELTNQTEELKKGRIITELLIDRYNSESLFENEPTSPDKTSYVKNKGKIISLCLREKGSGKNKFHNLNLILFVFIHELAHIVSVSYSHDTEFWTNFKFLLEFCEKHNLYKSQNYASFNVVYCGLVVEYNPVFDNNIKSYFR
jgi:hypothetical protein